MKQQSCTAAHLALGMAMGAAGAMAMLYAGDRQFRRQVRHLADEAACTMHTAARHLGM